MSIVDHKDGSITLTCEHPGCDRTDTYPTEEQAFDAGWDGVGMVRSWAPCCPDHPGFAATFGEVTPGDPLPLILVDEIGRYTGRVYADDPQYEKLKRQMGEST